MINGKHKKNRKNKEKEFKKEKKEKDMVKITKKQSFDSLLCTENTILSGK